jgi:hypothetical protein
MGITQIEHARFLKKINCPLNMPVKERVFSSEYSRHWVGLMKAHGDFVQAVGKFVTARAGARGKWRVVNRRLAALRKSILKCDTFIGKLLGGEEMSKVRDGTASEQDQHEAQLFAHFIVERATPFVEYWKGVVDAVEGGAELTIRPGDIPPWTDEE